VTKALMMLDRNPNKMPEGSAMGDGEGGGEGKGKRESQRDRTGKSEKSRNAGARDWESEMSDVQAGIVSDRHKIHPQG
jgi:hypothetical protein